MKKSNALLISAGWICTLTGAFLLDLSSLVVGPCALIVLGVMSFCAVGCEPSC